MIPNIALELEQEQRLASDRAAIDAQIEQDTDLYHIGRFDGLAGCEPTRVDEHGYWEGYQIGLRQYWARKLGIEIPTEF